MTPLMKKLNWKNHSPVVVLNAPTSFEEELFPLTEVVVRRSIGRSPFSFLLAFVTTTQEIARLSQKLVRATDDALIWFAYPKGTSKNYHCEFNRDTGWEILGTLGYEGVRMVALDADWSALRFRQVHFIKQMKRDPKRALSPEGKKRTRKEQ